ncbi:MAG TPA: glycosyl hydrolase family 28-related protein [Fimbriimonadaceae bacterium]|nr:glycosyl hydrolase family 28-related protein [Fimbriimonadaceae bacterium]
MVALTLTLLGSQLVPDALNVLQFGADKTGRVDATNAFQTALDAAATPGGGTVWVPRGKYLFRGNLRVPVGVTLKGSWNSVPSHIGLRNPGFPKPGEGGTTLLVTANAGKSDGPAFLTLSHNATVQGVVIFYPEQTPSPKPYPFAIASKAKNPAILDVELLNPYQGIEMNGAERPLIRNVTGQPLRIGVLTDGITDIGRYENIHFNPWWSMKPETIAFQMGKGEAFVFGRTDWHSVTNCFAYGYHVGFRFIETQQGVANGSFIGIGADDCETAIQVDQCAPFGLLITNGQFVSFKGPDPTMVVVGPQCKGVVSFVNSAFWGPCHQIARVAGGTVRFSDCTFVQWDAKNQGRAAIQATGGRLIVRGCDFREDKPHVKVGEGVADAVLSENLAPNALRVENRSPRARISP